ncbi:MAG: hypothetical protein JWP97_4327 [Labilithrix sp.]|nr:hypothetical protein [Labilithrix sp.]
MKPTLVRSLGLGAALAGLALASAAMVHCAESGDAPSFDVDAGRDTGPAGFAEASTLLVPPDNQECVEQTKQVYVIATDKVLYRFYPQTLKFERVGMVACPSAAGTFSMAISRYGIAYVEYTDGRLFAVDTLTARCYVTPFKPGLTGFENFGMGYAVDGEPNYDGGVGDAGDADAADPDAGDGEAEGGADGGDAGVDASVHETLYVSGAGLGSLDTKSYDIKFLGSLTYGRTELTGRDRDLFAFAVGSGIVAGLDKTNAATRVTYRTTAVAERAAFAFAHWGGAFYIFTGDERSMVTKYSPAEDRSEVVVQDTGMLIVGAGSSTCAPSAPPR